MLIKASYFLFFLLTTTTALIDQAPCTSTPVSDDSIPLCTNLTSATTSVWFWKLDNNQIGFLELFFRIVYVPTSDSRKIGNKNITVCTNEFGFCDECYFANYTNTTNPLTMNCTAKHCFCQNITEGYFYEANVGNGFYRYNIANASLNNLDLDSGPYLDYEGNTNPFDFYYLDLQQNNKRFISQIDNSSYPDIYVTFKQPTLTITLEFPIEVYILVEVLSENDFTICKKSCDVIINENWLITNEILTVSIFIGDDLVKISKFNTTAVTFCPIPNNPFSPVWSQSWDCLGVTGKFLFICSWIGAIVVLISCLVILYKGACCVYHRYDNSVYITVDNRETEMEDIPSRKSISEMVEEKLASFRMGHPPLSTVALFFLISLTLANPICTDSIIGTAEISTCTVNTFGKSCSYNLNLEVALSGIGSSACINLMDDKGEVLKKIIIEYTQSMKVVSLRKLYYTSDWLASAWSKQICSGSVVGGNKAIDDFCGFWNNLTTTCLSPVDGPQTLSCLGIPVGGDISPYCREGPACWPGEYICQLGSNKNCGAFDYGDAYIFGKYAFLPVGPVYKVLSPDAAYIIPKLTVSVETDGTEKFSTLTYEDSVRTIDSGLSVEILGELSSSITEFGANKFILGLNATDSPVAYYGTACEQNVPCANSIGDIQANLDTKFHVYSTGLDQFVYPNNAVQARIKDGAMDFIFPKRGLKNQIPVLDKLPSIINGNLWTISEETLWINNVNPGKLLVKLKTNGFSFITADVNTFCPIFDDLLDTNLVGCSNCPQGLVINLFGKSTCQSGLATFQISCDQGSALLISPTCKLNTTNTLCQLRIRPSAEILSCIISLINSDPLISFKFNALTPELETITNTTQEKVILPPSTLQDPAGISSDSVTNGFLDWFNGLSGWGATVKWVIVAIIAVCLSLLSIYLIYTLIGCLKK